MASQPPPQQWVAAGRQHHPTYALLCCNAPSAAGASRVVQRIKDVLRYTLLQRGKVHGKISNPDDGDDLQQGCRVLGVLPLLPLAAPIHPEPSFRFWIDEVLWSQGRAAVELIEEVLTAAGGRKAGGPPRQGSTGGMQGAAARGDLGASHVSEWELLWSKSTYALQAARGLVPGQQVSAVVGLNCLTMKKRMLQTLKAAHGDEGASELTPLSFALPEELDQWVGWLRSQQQEQEQGRQQQQRRGRQGQAQESGQVQRQQGSDRPTSHITQAASGGQIQQGVQQQSAVSDTGQASGGAGGRESWGKQLWMLKTGQDAGKGLRLMTAAEALDYASQPSTWYKGRRRKEQLQVAQLYVTHPLLIDGRKWHLRLWLVVTGHNPLQAYLHRRGLVLFSSELYDGSTHQLSPSQMQDGAASTGPREPHWSHIPHGHITNLARNSSGPVWALAQLAARLGSAAWEQLWGAIQANIAGVLFAAKGPMQEAHAWLRPSIRAYGFQMVGLDYLVDSDLRPWLLEVNSAPSIMALHEDPGTASLIRTEKTRMLEDMVSLIRHRLHREPVDKGKASSRMAVTRSSCGQAGRDKQGARQSAAAADQSAECPGEFVQIRV